MVNAIPGLSHRLARVYRPLTHSSVWLPVSLTLAVVGVGIMLAYVQVRISPLFALLPVLALPIGLLLASRPDIGLLLVVFIIPLEDFHLAFGLPPSLSVVKLLSLVVFGAAIVHFCVFRKLDRLVSAPQNWLIGFFLAAVVLSYFVAIAPARTLEQTFKLLRVLTLYFMVSNVVRDESDLRRLLWVFLISGTICAAYGLYNYHFNPATLVGERSTGTMANANAFAAAMTVRLPLALYMIKSERRKLLRVLLVGSFAIMAYGIALSGSRSGLLSFAVAMGLFILQQKHKIVTLLLVAGIALAMIFVMPHHLKQRVGLEQAEKTGDQDQSTERRMTYQIYGLQLIQKNPILGIGLDGFAEAYGRSSYRFLQTSKVKRVAHDMYMEIAVGTGLVGFIPFIMLLFYSLYSVWRISRLQGLHPYLSDVSAGIFAGLCGFLFYSIFGSQQYAKTLWLLIALIVVLQQLAQKSITAKKELNNNENHLKRFAKAQHTLSG
jgi:probable O-glycosylation ligase (exosortase A-associated)